VNNEIQVFNRKLKKVTKPFKHVTILETSTNRKDYTHHGMHLNKLGKRQIAGRIVSEIVGVNKKEMNNPIYLNWKLEVNRICVSPIEHEPKKVDEDHPVKEVEVEKKADNVTVDESKKELDKRNKGDYQLNEVVDAGNLVDYGTVVEDMNMNILKKPKRIRRVPTTRTEDFLW
jgi:hypothetical protein